MTVPVFETRLARNAEEKRAGQRLRYAVFVEELGAHGPLLDHKEKLEKDIFDEYADQLLLFDRARPEEDQVIGVYRLMDQPAAAAAGGFYSEGEFDLAPLLGAGRRVLELGRSCLHRDYRGGPALMHLWQALAAETRAREAEILFGVASFHGTDVEKLAAPLSLLSREYLAPDDLRVRSRAYQEMNLIENLDRLAAMRAMPPLIKAYLRLGGRVGKGAFIDHAFNTTDVCILFEANKMNRRKAKYYGGHHDLDG